MEKEKTFDDAGKTVQKPVESCPRNYKPWIWTLVVMAIFTIAWALYEGYKKEGYLSRFFEGERNGSPKNSDVKLSALGTAGVPEPARILQDSYHRIIENVRPAVISIDAAVQDFPFAANQGGTISPELVTGIPVVNFNRIGSGVIIEPKGYVLTSYHVVAGAAALKATVYGQGGAIEYPLKVVKADQGSDLALLRLQGNGPFPYAILGNSDAARTGDVVIAMGSPFGFDQSITSGIISSRNRTINIGGTVYENLIQTDSPINRGSSGGPLVSTKGEVVGINTAIYSPTGTFSGIGFAIPINRASELVGGVVDFKNLPPDVGVGQLAAWTRCGRQVGNAFRLPDGQTLIPPHQYRGTCVDCHPQLLNQVAFGPNNVGPGARPGCVIQNVAGPKTANVEPFLGVTLVDVDEIIARQFNMIHPEGVLVNSVLPGTPAEAAGLTRGDILIRIDGKKIHDLNNLRQYVGAQKVGNRFEIVFLRNGSRQTAKIKTGVVQAPVARTQVKQAAEFEWIGADITPLVPAVVPYEKTGVYVMDVEGILAAAGLKVGDIIKGINGNQVMDMTSFIKLAKKVDIKKGFVLDIVRSGNPMYITVKG